MSQFTLQLQLLEVTHCSQGRIWNLCANSHDEQNPGLGIIQRLPCLVHLEVFILDSLPVARNPFDSNPTLLLGKEFRCSRQVREKEQDHNPYYCACRAEYQEDIHPAGQPSLYMAYCVANQSAEHCCDAISAIIGSKPEGLLG